MEKNKDYIEKLVHINRITKVVKGGRRFGFSALVVVGNQNGKIGIAHAKAKNCAVVRDYCGHGIGVGFHEMPQVIHYDDGKVNRSPILEQGMTFTIEPMINLGGYEVITSKLDGWTVTTKDRSLSAQWEHTILVTENGYEILTLRKEELNS